MNFAAMVHGGQEFEWGEPACSGDEITTTAKCLEIYEKDGKGFYVFEIRSVNQDGDRGRARAPGPTSSGGSEMASLNVGDAIPELRVTPDKYLPHRYAGASGDFNPIHIDPEFAKAVGLPSTILHGLYMMGLVARANAARRGRRPAGAQAALGAVPRHGRAGDRRSSSPARSSRSRATGDHRHGRRSGREPDDSQRRGRSPAVGVPSGWASQNARQEPRLSVLGGPPGAPPRLQACFPLDKS